MLNSPEPMPDTQLDMITPKDLESIIAAGIAAPSADNSQPWLYRPHDGGIDVWIDARRSNSPSDAGYVLSDLALGAVVENLCLQAGTLGYDSKVDYLPAREASPLWVARLNWVSRSPGEHDALATAIPQRHTDRRFPFRGPVTDGVLQALTAQARHQPETALLLLNDDRKNTALRLLRRAETLRFRYQALHQELFSHVRWEAGWHTSCPEGLPPAALAVEPPMRPLFKSLRHWRVMALMNRVGAATLLGFRAAYLPARLSPVLCLLTVSNADRITIVKAGRTLQRVWLQATACGMAVQPFAAAGLFTLGKMDLGPAFHAEVPPLRVMMEALCPRGQHGLIFLRLGYPPRMPPPRSRRRGLAEFLAS